jgi:predicted HicB family RNase H-like nuclease
VAISEARKRANAKYDKENFQYITFKARKGAKERLSDAAAAVGMSTNGFIRVTLSKAVEELTGQPMESPKSSE